MPKKVSIDELAAMIKRGFDATASKQDLRSLETRVATLETRMATKDDLKMVVTKVDHLEDNLNHVSAQVDRIRGDIGEIKQALSITQRLERLEKAVFGMK